MVKSVELKREFLLFSVVLALMLAVFSLQKLNAADKQKAPNFTLKSNQGKNVRLSDMAGEIVLLNFWASWCGPCRQEMPILNEINKKYSALGFKVLGVNVDLKPEKAQAYLKSTPVDFPVLFDPQGQASELFDVSAMPTTVLIDKDGNMRYLHKGYKPGDEKTYHKKIKQLLRE